MNRPMLLRLALLAVTLATASPTIAAPYKIVDLGTLPGTTSSAATAINKQGQVVGVSYNAGDGSFRYGEYPFSPGFQSTGGGQSFLYQNGAMSQANPVGGFASDINERGQIVGGDHTSINDLGQYVGANSHNIESYSGTASSSSTHMSTAFGINNQGTVVGANGAFNQFTGYSLFPAVLQDGKITYLYSGPDPASREPAIDGQAVDVNDKNQALVNVLVSSTGKQSSFLYDIATKGHVDLTNLAGGAGKLGVALNNSGEVVGNDFLYDGSTIHKLTDLLTSSAGWSGLNATDINDEGQIVGQGTIDGELHAFLMTPDDAQVPEPGAMIAWASIAALAALRLRRR